MSDNIVDIRTKQRAKAGDAKAPPPWFRFFPKEFLISTRGLTAAETGILIRMLAEMHERGEPLTEDHARLARFCGTMTVNFRAALGSLIAAELIVRRGPGLWSPIVQAEVDFRREHSTRAIRKSEENSIKSMPENDRVLEKEEIKRDDPSRPPHRSSTLTVVEEPTPDGATSSPKPRTFFVGAEMTHPRLGTYTVTAISPSERKVRIRFHSSGEVVGATVRPEDRFATAELDDTVPF